MIDKLQKTKCLFTKRIIPSIPVPNMVAMVTKSTIKDDLKDLYLHLLMAFFGDSCTFQCIIILNKSINGQPFNLT